MKQRTTLYPRICRINDSTNLIEIAYDPVDREMLATFGEGVKYVYNDIPANWFASIVSAESTGKMFNSIIKNNNVKGVKIDE